MTTQLASQIAETMEPVSASLREMADALNAAMAPAFAELDRQISAVGKFQPLTRASFQLPSDLMRFIK